MKGKVERVPTICGICPGGCGVEAILRDGLLEGIAPKKEHPMGMICTRGKHAAEVVYSPDRLRHPLKRVGTRGNGEFEEISWEEALDMIANGMQAIKERFGPQAMAIHSGRGSFEDAFVEFFHASDYNIQSINGNFLYPFGSPNNSGVGSLCYLAFGLLAPMATFGMPMSRTNPDYANSDLILIWGTNPATNSPPALLPRLLAAQRRGAELVVIDPMGCDIAKRANQWIPIRPGTDGALALGLINLLIEAGHYDQDFVANWTLGFAELAAYVKAFTPEIVETITSVAAATVRELAAKLAPPRRFAINMYTGLEYTNSGVQNIRAVLTLWAMTGNLDQPGGLLLWPEAGATGKVPAIVRPTSPPPVGANQYSLYTELTQSAHFMEMPRAVLEDDPYPVRGLIVQGSSILTSYPDPDLWSKVFQALDLLVVIDRFLTADAAYADYVLPATTYFENTSFQRYRGFTQLRRPVIDPVGEARSDFNIFAALATRLGYGHLYPRDEEEMVEWAFARQPDLLVQLKEHPEGVRAGKASKTFRKYVTGQLRPDGQPGFPTPSGKFEIASSLLAKYGYEPLPVFREPVESPVAAPELVKQYPLILNTGARLQSAFRSQHLNIPGLIKNQPVPHVLINPGDAAVRDIADGERVWVSTKRSRVPFYAMVTDDVLRGTVEVNMGGGGPLGPRAWQEGNANILTDPDNRDPISGFPVLKALLCEVTKE